MRYIYHFFEIQKKMHLSIYILCLDLHGQMHCCHNTLTMNKKETVFEKKCETVRCISSQ